MIHGEMNKSLLKPSDATWYQQASCDTKHSAT